MSYAPLKSALRRCEYKLTTAATFGVQSADCVLAKIVGNVINSTVLTALPVTFTSIQSAHDITCSNIGRWLSKSTNLVTYWQRHIWVTSRTTSLIPKDRFKQKMLRTTQLVHNQQSVYLGAGCPIAIVCMGRGAPCHGFLLSRLQFFFFQLRGQLGPCRTKY